MTRPVAITAWSVTSPFGAGRRAFVEGLASGRSAVAPIDSASWGISDEQAALVPDFNAREVLGKKGTRGMNRLSGLAVSTVRMLREDVELDERTGVILGTTMGSPQTMMETVRASLEAELPHLVEPSTLPYGVMNGAAGQCAIWYGYRGPNTTLAAGRPTGFTAFNYARRLLLTGRAETVLTGAAEEFTRARSWLELHGRAEGTDRSVLGEGCAMFALTTAPATAPLAEVLSLDFGVRRGDWPTAVREVVRKALDKAGLTSADIGSTCPSGAVGEAGEAEQAVLAELSKRTVTPLQELIGETHAASAAFQVASVLALAERDPDAVGRIVLLTSTDPLSGAVAAAVLRTGRS
ncbi:beta-ketoacyl synthase N-terminal-like domain-containing protein [Kitasatospora sp. NPDC048239]|uniref:beta-ketoacyl synthase N-terminal-like domain-containing protein n=1 Tax=Kitasatospora sp. NPDC048239 TaxID=3364046 RepID=UPI00371A7AE6